MKSVTLAILSLTMVAACGGPTPEAKDATLDSAAAPEASAPVAPEASAVASSAPTSAPSAAPTAEAPVAGPTTLTGSLAGKEFAPQAAFAMMGAKEGTVLVEILDQAVYCGALPQTPGARKVGFLVPWKVGSTTDPKTLKGGKEPEAYVMSVNAQKKFDRKDWKATGSIQIVRAPRKGGDFGRIKLDTKQGKETLTGEIDVKICGDLP